MNDNEVREIAEMQRRIDDYNYTLEYLSRIIRKGEWDDVPNNVYHFPICGEQLMFLKYLCKEHSQVFKEYRKYVEMQTITASTSRQTDEKRIKKWFWKRNK